MSGPGFKVAPIADALFEEPRFAVVPEDATPVAGEWPDAPGSFLERSMAETFADLLSGRREAPAKAQQRRIRLVRVDPLPRAAYLREESFQADSRRGAWWRLELHVSGKRVTLGTVDEQAAAAALVRCLTAEHVAAAEEAYLGVQRELLKADRRQLRRNPLAVLLLDALRRYQAETGKRPRGPQASNAAELAAAVMAGEAAVGGGR